MATPKLTAMIADELKQLHDTVYRLGQLADAAKQEAVPTREQRAFAKAVRTLQRADAALRETNLVMDAYRDDAEQTFAAATVVYATPAVETA
jgi:hypothetical protein